MILCINESRFTLVPFFTKSFSGVLCSEPPDKLQEVPSPPSPGLHPRQQESRHLEPGSRRGPRIATLTKMLAPLRRQDRSCAAGMSLFLFPRFNLATERGTSQRKSEQTREIKNRTALPFEYILSAKLSRPRKGCATDRPKRRFGF